MKKLLKKCSGTRADNSGYDNCDTFFLSDTCPKCGAIKPYELGEIEIPELGKIHGHICRVITNLNMLTCLNELSAEKELLKESVKIMEGVV